MKPILVTGATGFVGWHVARQLLDQGLSVRTLARDPERSAQALGSLGGMEVMQGDLRDAATVAKAMAGCGVVYHVAADYRLWVRNAKEMFASNVEGTRNVLKAARSAGVERIVYTSTVGCIGFPKDQPGNETTPVSIDDMQGPYKRSKFLAELVALEAAQTGLPVVIVNPTTPVGDHDFKPTPTGKMILDFLRGAMPAYLDTGLNIVDVCDVACGHIQACEHGRVGERYILGGENLTLRQIFEQVAQATGRSAPRLRIPYAVAYGAGIVSTGWASISGKQPLVPLDGVRMARKKMWVRHDKAADEWGYKTSPAGQALARAANWFELNGYCEDVSIGRRRTA